MAYTRSLKEIPLEEEPHASVLAALTPDPFESPYSGVDLSGATDGQRAHLAMCPRCRDALGLDPSGTGAASSGGEIGSTSFGGSGL
jgi:hypothetical protein